MPIASAAADVGPFDCHLRLPAEVRAGSPVPLTFELINRGKSPMYVLTWNTPLEGWFGKFLRVTRDGQEIPYRGPQVKRGRPEPADYALVRAKGSIRATLDLMQTYAVDIPGRYEISFDGRLHDATRRRQAGAEESPHELHCNSVTVEVVGSP